MIQYLMYMCLICINDDLRNNSNITITQRLRHGLFENFPPFILFFWLALWIYELSYKQCCEVSAP